MLYNPSFHDMTLSKLCFKGTINRYKSPIHDIYINLHKNNNIVFFLN